MKKISLLLVVSIAFCFKVSSQTISNAVTSTLVSNATNQVTVYAKSNVALVDKHFNNIVISLSITDPGVADRPNLTVGTNHIPDVAVTPQTPYEEGGRMHYDFIAVNNSNAPGVNTNTWIANTPYPVLTINFSNGNGFSSSRLDHWDSPTFGPSGNSQIYYEIIQAGNGDITAQSDIFFGTLSVINDPGGWSSGTSFAPIQPLAVLPVKFKDFNVIRNKDKALLNWSVEEESSNTDKYEVLRSTNGVDFTSIATIKAFNNGGSSNIYNFTQENLSALRTKGVIYFRIKQIDKDGKFVYTDIKNIRLNTKGILVGVYPNPIKQNTTLSFDLVENSRVNYSITDAAGKMIEAYQVQGFKGSNIKTLNLGKYAAGAYTLKVQAGDEIITLPLVKATN